jgi:hypothetical protein
VRKQIRITGLIYFRRRLQRGIMFMLLYLVQSDLTYATVVIVCISLS